MTPDDLHSYLAQFRDSDWSQLTVTDGRDSLHVSRVKPDGGTSGAGAPRPPRPPDQPADLPPVIVRSPSVGRLRLSGQPAAAPAPGEHVTAGSWLADLIVADRTERVLSPAAGTLTSRLAADGEAVQYGQPLAVIQP